MATSTDLLMLADGRLPAGGHAHSGGLEQAVEQGDVVDIPTLEAFLHGLLRTNAGTSIAVAAAACAARHTRHDARLLELDQEESARTPSAAVRTASRAQGRQLLRAAVAIWPAPGPIDLPPLPHGPHLSLAQGLAAARLGLPPLDAARLAAYCAVSGPATAAVRLLGLDPFSVHGTVARVVREAEPLIASAAEGATAAATDLPCGAAPLIEIGAELHRVREIRMFAS
jgi:urease accessory protein